jgi:hypothetical protein
MIKHYGPLVSWAFYAAIVVIFIVGGWLMRPL